MNLSRVERELAILKEGGQMAELMLDDAQQAFVIYSNVPTGGVAYNLPNASDVLVPVPSGYPGALIDLAALPDGSPFLGRVKGGRNILGQLNVGGRRWLLASYHPHAGGGGPTWDQLRHGFHTYLDHLIAWLGNL